MTSIIVRPYLIQVKRFSLSSKQVKPNLYRVCLIMMGIRAEHLHMCVCICACLNACAVI